MREKDYPPKPPHPGLEAAVERTEAKFLSRYAVPALVFMLLAVSGFAFNLVIGRLDTLAKNDADRSDDVNQIKSDLRDLNTRLDAGALRQVETNKSTLEDHEKRLQVLERVVKVP